VAEAFFRQVSGQARAAGLLSDEHFTVDGTLLEACAGQKSFRPKDGQDSGGSGSGGGRDFRSERRTNETHASTTDDEARLYKKGPGKEAKLCYLGHVVADNRHGLLVGTRTTLATGTAEREAAEKMLRRARRRRRATVGADKGYDSRAFVERARALGVTPHVAQNTSNRSSAIDERTTRHAGYEISQWKRKLVEQPFGWMKTVGLLRKLRHRGRRKVGWTFTLTAAVYNLVRMRTLGLGVVT
jgi:IS5 family transposase